ncbi:hypothetical protein C0991_010404 [Blastosporella zonata]|nr:hypothetical protein C0991_010404 [Blastosporella zonata]
MASSKPRSESAFSEKDSLPSKDDNKQEHLVPTHLQFDLGNEVVRYRKRWWQVWIPRDPPPPPRATLSDAPILGYQRTLQATDLWKLDPAREAGPLSDKLDQAWDRRKAEAAAWNAKLDRGEIKPGFLKRSCWSIRALAHGSRFSEKVASYEFAWREKDGRKTPSLAWALNDIVGFYFWSAGAFKVFGDTSALMGPLLVKAIINFAKARAAAKEDGTEAPHIATARAQNLSWQLGPSALAGFALFLCVAPIQERVMSYVFKIRRASMKYSDERAKTLLEVLGAMRVVKYFCYEGYMTPEAASLKGFGKYKIPNLLSSAAFAYSIPVLAATLSFVVYTSTTAGFDVAIIFASFSLFQLLRQPMMFLPRALSATADARNALNRLTPLFHAEVMEDVAFKVDPEQEYALEATDATFEWETFASQPTNSEEKTSESETASPFKVGNINMLVPRGSLVAIVGRVGSGKSSLLQGLIGEMRHVSGKFSFGGQVAYCPQSAWIQNASLRDNILFGKPFDEDRYWRVLEDACLLPDLHLLPNADLTEASPNLIIPVIRKVTFASKIGEKGINLSGGQKQRVNIARALYYDADVVILDDPLSAVDAHVGKALFHGAIVDSLRNKGKSVILVTHALHFLSHCDYIYTLDAGRIAEHGTYEHLASLNGEFARLDKEFGGKDTITSSDDNAPALATDIAEELKIKSAKASRGITGDKLAGKLIVKEVRTTGSVSWSGTTFPFDVLTAITDYQGPNSLWDISCGWSRTHLAPSPPFSDPIHARQPNHEFIYPGVVARKVRIR